MTAIIPQHILRMYLVDLLVNNDVIDLSDYEVGGVQLSPIVPVEDEPKLAPLNKLYAVYGFAESEEKKYIPVDHNASMSLMVYGTSSGDVAKFMNTISLALEDPLIATPSINDFSSNHPDHSAVFDGIRFTSLYVQEVEGIEPASSEGGRQAGIISLKCCYINRQPVKIYQNGVWP